MPRWSGEYHIVDTTKKTSLESHALEHVAADFCESVNVHEAKNGRGRPYVVEKHPIEWRGY